MAAGLIFKRVQTPASPAKPLIRMPAETRLDGAVEREVNSARREVRVIEDSILNCLRPSSGLRQDRNFALGGFGEGMQYVAAWIEVPKSELLLGDREMAEAVDLLREGAAG